MPTLDNIIGRVPLLLRYLLAALVLCGLILAMILPRAAILRAVHNGAMDSLMLLVAGYAYLAVGGIHPIGVPGLVDIVPLLVMALAAQAVNVVHIRHPHRVAEQAAPHSLAPPALYIGATILAFAVVRIDVFVAISAL